MGGFLDYVPGSSILHRLNPLTKLVMSLVLCISCFLSGSHFFVLGIIALNLIFGAIAGVAGRAFHILKALLKLSVFLFIIQVLFVKDGNVILSFPPFIITDSGILFSLLFCLRLIAATLPLAMMLSVTQMSDLTGALVGKLGVSYKYTFALTTAIRFIPVFTNEMADITEAQIARGVDFDTKNFFKKIKLLLPLCVPLLVSSVKRIESGAIAAELRGFNCRKKDSGYREYPFRAADFASFAAGFVLIVLSRII